MRRIHKLVNERYAKAAAGFMRYVCYVVMAFFVVCLVLSIMGRQTFRLQTSTGFYERAICAEEDHDYSLRGFTVSSDDEIYVRADADDRVDLATRIGISLMYAFKLIPLFLGYLYLSRVFRNINRGEIFTGENSSCLLYYGLVQIFVALFVPFISMLICSVSNLFSGSLLSVSTGSNVLNGLFPGIAFVVAAYIIHYGIYLQDEVDHTL
ncbi:hypothetical protein B5F07_06320 [Lachnoclostridium sp. An169]|uniref:DUF2975 domain-containing protein n=1 Tax=Lachnoclostridium sp. An169 TaxID=1965569 RepID=UPI000B389F39|nr:DUF2975 domain-containing protein [Lachnoclostridium sp. An169]OUP84866.1 hypothetical protein B5F07_06320 [Lachnoclostridium sp. An169]HJA65265.1 DUF2975 domain-containing protein [Candidatus Mediterraneibacter cottocaccae]